MQVLLKKEVEHLGIAGQVVDVKPGYARNYLVPQNMAIFVTRKNRKSIEKEIERFEIQEKKRLGELRELANQISEAKCTVAVNADENDKLYGSVTADEISKSLKINGFEIPHKWIKIKKPIKSIGVFEVTVQLDKEISAELKVWVVKE